MFNVLGIIFLFIIGLLTLGFSIYLRAYLTGGLLLKIWNELIIPTYSVEAFPYPRNYLTIALVIYSLIHLIFKTDSTKRSKYHKLEGKEKAIEITSDLGASYAMLGVVWVVIEVVVWVLHY